MFSSRVFSLFLGAVAAQGSDTRRVSVAPQQVLQTPQAITPAVLPYIACLYDLRGVPLLKVMLGTAVSYDRNDQNCSATRRRSAAEALKLVKDAPTPSGSTRAAYVENALADIDAYVRSLPERLPEKSRDGPERTLSVAMEDEVKPAYDRYTDCLANQMVSVAVTADTIMPTFQRVMTICRSIREAAVRDAEKALAKKGWDAPTRAKAAEDTFAAADRQWLSIGREYQQALFSQARAAPKPSSRAKKN